MVESLTLDDLDIQFNPTGFGPLADQSIGEFKGGIFKPYYKKDKTGKLTDSFLPQGVGVMQIQAQQQN